MKYTILFIFLIYSKFLVATEINLILTQPALKPFHLLTTFKNYYTRKKLHYWRLRYFLLLLPAKKMRKILILLSTKHLLILLTIKPIR
jgi:hypothetical protein